MKHLAAATGARTIDSQAGNHDSMKRRLRVTVALTSRLAASRWALLARVFVKRLLVVEASSAMQSGNASWSEDWKRLLPLTRVYQVING